MEGKTKDDRCIVALELKSEDNEGTYKELEYAITEDFEEEVTIGCFLSWEWDNEERSRLRQVIADKFLLSYDQAGELADCFLHRPFLNYIELGQHLEHVINTIQRLKT
jgi:hypothetical protein